MGESNFWDSSPAISTSLLHTTKIQSLDEETGHTTCPGFSMCRGLKSLRPDGGAEDSGAPPGLGDVAVKVILSSMPGAR
ncbi:unnamed protein product [Protopolystoma xenopodis]|uniref:Uncharacterized protein n=1 Tax=Protopolystoma xenopodis TaxID=117903 RepID=A0A3S4ZSD8_9PLAT|nr:unnamed protein product [Protopolystoma xenopodis]